MTYDSTSLDQELRAAGLRIHGCRSWPRRGREGEDELLEIVDWIDPPTEAEKTAARQVMDAHDSEHRMRELAAERVRAVDLAARLARGLATQTERDEALAWVLTRDAR